METYACRQSEAAANTVEVSVVEAREEPSLWKLLAPSYGARSDGAVCVITVAW